MLKDNGFEPTVSLQNLEEKSAVIGLLMSRVNFATRMIVGPPLEKIDAVEQFMNAHRGSLLMAMGDNRAYAIEKAKYPDPESLIRGFIKSKNTRLPSNFDARKATLYVNKVPERYAKLVYAAYVDRFSI